MQNDMHTAGQRFERMIMYRVSVSSTSLPKQCET